MKRFVTVEVDLGTRYDPEYSTTPEGADRMEIVIPSIKTLMEAVRSPDSIFVEVREEDDFFTEDWRRAANAAASLWTEDGDSNPEYERALVEIVTRLSRGELSHDDPEEVVQLIKSRRTTTRY